MIAREVQKDIGDLPRQYRQLSPSQASVCQRPGFLGALGVLGERLLGVCEQHAFPWIGRVHVGSKKESNRLKKKESACSYLTFEDWPGNSHGLTKKILTLNSEGLLPLFVVNTTYY